MTHEKLNDLMAHREDIWFDVRRELELQWKRYGGPDHDDTHSRRDWVSLICGRLGKADRHADEIATAGYISAMIEVAALAIAAIESTERMDGSR